MTPKPADSRWLAMTTIEVRPDRRGGWTVLEGDGFRLRLHDWTATRLNRSRCTVREAGRLMFSYSLQTARLSACG